MTGVSRPHARYSATRSRQACGSPCTTSSSTSSSVIAATAPRRSPACHASCMGLSASARPSQAWNAAYTGTVMYAVMRRRPMPRATSASAVGHTKIRAASSHSSPATARIAGTSDGASQFVIAASASAAASRSMPGRSAASARPGGTAGGGSSRNPRTAKVSYSWPQDPQHVAGPLVGPVQRDAVPLLDDHLRGRADAEHEPAGRQLGDRRRAHRQQGRPAGVQAGDRGAQPQPVRPAGGQGERGERVHAVRLGRPRVGVAEGLQPLHDLAMLGQSHPGQGEREPPPCRPSCRHALTLLSGRWPAVGRGRPIVAVRPGAAAARGRCTRPARPAPSPRRPA